MPCEVQSLSETLPEPAFLPFGHEPLKGSSALWVVLPFRVQAAAKCRLYRQSV